MVNYYFHCRRQCWLFSNRVNLEDNSEDVRIGRILHALKAEKAKKKEVAIESIKIDKLTPEYLVEIKKSDADLEAVKWQTLFYLYVLKQKGIKRKGRIEVIEKKKKDHKIYYVELSQDIINQIKQLIIDIHELIEESVPPKPIHKTKCKKCAYYEYCYI
ncbi:CRISPR-associated protein Cas4 [Terrilactibacillus sp. BCM23-1]|uniref:CRISPR-associated exonuclease Cas4 n=2 Tax=Terrilactibacillus tamarindi TaxID=2599694 RepID=A0A6N8CMR2_9BACI|nr:CRISPR-associated protein Cas4 [Terrilactibacillus tamarindi]